MTWSGFRWRGSKELMDDFKRKVSLYFTPAELVMFLDIGIEDLVDILEEELETYREEIEREIDGGEPEGPYWSDEATD